MPSSEPFLLADYSVLLRLDGSSSITPRTSGPPPAKDGINLGLAEMDRPPPHGGECHPDGDEMIILLSGELSIRLEEAVERTVRLRPGEAFIVRRGIWHRLMFDRPCRLIHLSPGRRKVRPLDARAISGR